MKKVFIIAFLLLFFSCNKENPGTSRSGVVVNPQPPSPIYPISLACSGSWICLSNPALSNIWYTGTGNSVGANGAAAVADNKIFFAGGHEEAYGATLESVSIYSPSTITWQYKNLSLPRSRLAGVSVGNTVLFAGGNNSMATNPVYAQVNWGYHDAVDIFDATTLSQTVARLSEPRACMASVSHNGKAFFIGGKNRTGYSKRIDVYDAATGVWSQMELPRERAYAGAIAAGNKIYIAGGKNAVGNLKTIDVYDVAAAAWSTIDAPNEHPYASVITLNDKIIIAGGDGLSNKSVDFYNLTTNTWTTSSLSDSRYDMAVGTANNKIIFVGGNYSRNMDVYNDITGNWSTGGIAGAGVTGVAAASLNDKCYFTGFLFDWGSWMTNGMVIIQP